MKTSHMLISFVCSVAALFVATSARSAVLCIRRPGLCVGLFLAALLLIQALPVSASLISVDFTLTTQTESVGHRASGDTQLSGTGVPINAVDMSFSGQMGAWNQVAFPANNSAVSQYHTNTLSLANLVDGDGQATGVSFSFNINNSRSWSFSASSSDPLRRDYLMHRPGGTYTNEWEITGLVTNQSYDLVLFSSNTFDANGDQFGRFTVNGSGILPWDSEGDVNLAGIKADGTGRIYGTFQGQSSYSSWAGFQLMAIPEPSTFALVLIGIVAMIRRRLWRA